MFKELYFPPFSKDIPSTKDVTMTTYGLNMNSIPMLRF